MQLDLGTKIRQLRHRDGRTQEALATALGVTSQAVSRWEANGSFPDMHLIPSIANYFGVSIDECEPSRGLAVVDCAGKWTGRGRDAGRPSLGGMGCQDTRAVNLRKALQYA